MTALEMAERLIKLVRDYGYDCEVEAPTMEWDSRYSDNEPNTRGIRSVEFGKDNIRIILDGWEKA